VFEGDECLELETGSFVPTYFDTNTAGVVPGKIDITEPKPGALVATFTNLRLSQRYPHERWCTLNLSGIKASIHDIVEGFVEENPPNLTLEIPTTNISDTCKGGPGEISEKVKGAQVRGDFYLETMSTLTDTAFVG
jgi:hypothetical protein